MYYSLYFFYLLSFIYTIFIAVFQISFNHYFNGFVFNVHFIFFSFQFSYVIIESYCTLFFNFQIVTS